MSEEKKIMVASEEMIDGPYPNYRINDVVLDYREGVIAWL